MTRLEEIRSHAFREELCRTDKDIHGTKAYIHLVEDDYKYLLSRVERLEAALKIYSTSNQLIPKEPKELSGQNIMMNLFDHGEIAREALRETEGEERG